MLAADAGPTEILPVKLWPAGNVVLAANPQLLNPFLDAAEIEVTGRNSGQIVLASGFHSHGQAVRRVRNKRGAVSDIWVGQAALMFWAALTDTLASSSSAARCVSVGSITC